MKPAKRSKDSNETAEMTLDPLVIVPPEVVESILSKLTVTDLLSCSRVSQLWNTATENDILWKKLCLSKGWKKCHEFDNCIDYLKSFSDEEMQRICSYGTWKRYFVLKNRVRYNWKNGNFRQSQLIATVGTSPITCTSTCNTMLAIGYSTGIVQVFDIRGDDHKLIQIIKCKKGYYIDWISISSNCLAFCDLYNLLFLFKVNEEGIFDFQFIISMSNASEVLSITDPSDFIADHYSDDDDDDNTEDAEESRIENLFNNINLRLNFSINDDFLVTLHPKSRAILFWNLNSNATIEPVRIFEHENSIRAQCIDFTDNIVTASFYHPGQDYWFIEAFSLNDNIQLYRSPKMSNPSPVDLNVSLQVSSSYTLNKAYYEDEVFQHKVNLFDKKGKLIYEAFTEFIDIAAYPDDLDFIAIEKNDMLSIYNPKTDCTIISIVVQGMLLGICNGVLVTQCDEYDRYGSSELKLEFWQLKPNSQQSDDSPSLVFPVLLNDYKNASSVICESNIRFVQNRSVYMLNFMV